MLRLSLSQQAGHDPHLIGLLRVFKDYYPEIIVGEAVRGRASAFKVMLRSLPFPSLRFGTDMLTMESILTPNGGRGWTRYKLRISSVRRTRWPSLVMASVFAGQ
jgi:hypothetical protein